MKAFAHCSRRSAVLAFCRGNLCTPPKFLQKPPPYFFCGSFAPSFIWCRRHWVNQLGLRATHLNWSRFCIHQMNLWTLAMASPWRQYHAHHPGYIWPHHSTSWLDAAYCYWWSTVVFGLSVGLSRLNWSRCCLGRGLWWAKKHTSGGGSTSPHVKGNFEGIKRPAQDMPGHVQQSIHSKRLSRGQHWYGVDDD